MQFPRVCRECDLSRMGLPCIYTHHISFLCEDGIVETLQGHPFVGHLHIGSVVLSEVAASIDVLSQTKVPYPDTPSRVQPIGYEQDHMHILSLRFSITSCVTEM